MAPKILNDWLTFGFESKGKLNLNYLKSLGSYLNGQGVYSGLSEIYSLSFNFITIM